MDLSEVNVLLEKQLINARVALKDEQQSRQELQKNLTFEIDDLKDELDITRAQLSTFEELKKRAAQYQKQLE